MSKDMASKDYLMDGENVDPNPTRGRTFILGENYVNTNHNSFTGTDPQKQKAAIASLMEMYPDLTEEEIMDFY